MTGSFIEIWDAFHFIGFIQRTHWWLAQNCVLEIDLNWGQINLSAFSLHLFKAMVHTSSMNLFRRIVLRLHTYMLRIVIDRMTLFQRMWGRGWVARNYKCMSKLHCRGLHLQCVVFYFKPLSIVQRIRVESKRNKLTIDIQVKIADSSLVFKLH